MSPNPLLAIKEVSGPQYWRRRSCLESTNSKKEEARSRNQEVRIKKPEARRSDRGTNGRSSEQRCSNDKLLRHFKIYWSGRGRMPSSWRFINGPQPSQAVRFTA